MSKLTRGFNPFSDPFSDSEFLRQMEELKLALEEANQELTEEEKVELNQLKDAYDAEVKSFKIARFKMLPTNIRQIIVDSIIFQKNISETTEQIPKPSERLKKLSNKSKPLGSFFGRRSSPGLSPSMREIEEYLMGDGSSRRGLPKYGYLDLSDDEILSSHSEACLEEQLNRSE